MANQFSTPSFTSNQNNNLHSSVIIIDITGA